MTVSPRTARWFDGLTLFTLAFTLLVILWGAWVRITGSGAGCGQHWPTCHGEIIPTDPALDTFIEFFHRVTSGLTVLIVIGLLVVAVRWFPKGHRARQGAWWTFIFIIIECLIGAALVVFALVGNNESVTRALLMAIHLVNTCLLTGAILVTLWWGRRDSPLGLGPDTALGLHVMVAFGVLMVVNASGAVTALGDTLYPIEDGPGAAAFIEAFSTRNILIQLRIWHPLLAVAGSIYLLWQAASVALRARGDGLVMRWSAALATLVVVQVVAGLVNVLLGAPGWMQIVHLLLAKLLWFAWVWFALHALRHARGEA